MSESSDLYGLKVELERVRSALESTMRASAETGARNTAWVALLGAFIETCPNPGAVLVALDRETAGFLFDDSDQARAQAEELGAIRQKLAQRVR